MAHANAHGLFGAYQGRPLGSFGRHSTLSFHETKNFICGEGGALVLNADRDVDAAHVLLDKGVRLQGFRIGTRLAAIAAVTNYKPISPPLNFSETPTQERVVQHHVDAGPGDGGHGLHASGDRSPVRQDPGEDRRVVHVPSIRRSTRSCHYDMPRELPERPCLDYHIERCYAPISIPGQPPPKTERPGS